MATLQDRLRATGWIERIGLGLFDAGSALDLTYHLSPATWLPTVERYVYTCSFHAQQMSGQVDVVAR